MKVLMICRQVMKTRIFISVSFMDEFFKNAITVNLMPLTSRLLILISILMACIDCRSHSDEGSAAQHPELLWVSGLQFDFGEEVGVIAVRVDFALALLL